MVVQFSGNDFVGGANDEIAFVRRQLAEITIDQGRRLLEHPKRMNQFRRHAIITDREVDQGARRLRAVVTVGGHLNRSHAVGFSTH